MVSGVINIEHCVSVNDDFRKDENNLYIEKKRKKIIF